MPSYSQSSSYLNYEQGKMDGFIDGCIISQPTNEDRHTLSKYRSVDSQYRQSIYNLSPSSYQIGYSLGVDLAAIYLKGI